ncbi:hypothetical protein SEVIR_7G149205v4 [Setaria viridis]
METPQALELGLRVLLLVAIGLLLKRVLLSLSPPFKRSGAPPFPRPRELPIIGNLHQLGALPQASLAALAAEHEAPLMLLRLGSVPALVVSSADAARAVFQRGNDRALSGRPALYAATRLSYGLQNISLAPPDGAFWRAARRACLSELLGAPRVRGFRFRGVREAEAAALVAAIADESSDGSAVNLSGMLVATTNRIVRRVALGDDSEDSIHTKAMLEEM